MDTTVTLIFGAGYNELLLLAWIVLVGAELSKPTACLRGLSTKGFHLEKDTHGGPFPDSGSLPTLNPPW